MNTTHQPDWDPTSDAVLHDQRAAYDEMRERCPAAYSDFLGWSLFRHQDVLRVLNDTGTFSSAVSTHLSVPNGMDPPEHTRYRRIVERYFQPERMQAFAPQCRDIAASLVQSLPGHGAVELISVLTQTFAVRAQCAFLGWPLHRHETLRLWTQNNREATLAQDRKVMAELSTDFEGYVNELLQSRRAAGEQPEGDIVASLLAEQVEGRLLRDEEIASILRNWTVGEVGTISASLGILVHYLAEHAALQQQLRAQPGLLPAAIEEILRLHGPLVANRRVTTCPVDIGGRRLGPGERISLNWVSANRDPAVFKDADTFRLDRNPAENLLWGAGIHVCPGAPLARMELRVVMEELLSRSTLISLVPGQPATRAVFPASGFSRLPLQISLL